LPPIPPLDPATTQRLLDHAGVAVILGDPLGTIVYANRAAGRMLARPSEALVGAAIHTLFAPDHREAFLDAWQAACKDTPAAGVEIEIQRADAVASAVEMDLLKVSTPAGPRVQITLRSLSVLKAAQAQTEEVALALSRARRAQAAGAGILRIPEVSLDDGAVAAAGITDIAKAMGAQLGRIYLSDGKALRLSAHYAPGERSDQEAESAFVTRLIREVLSDRRPAVLSPLPEDVDLLIRTGKWEKRPAGVAAFPLLYREAPLGALVLASVRPFSPEDVELIRLLADQITFALAATRAHARAEALDQELAAKQTVFDGQTDELLKKSEEIFSQDIDLRLKNEKLGKVEKLKKDFLDKMSRELRSPLNRMIGHLITVLTNDEESMSPESLDQLRAALGDGTAFSRTLNNLVDLWRMKEDQIPVDFKLVKFEAVVDEAVHHVAQLARERSVEMVRSFDPELDPIRTDLAKLTQVMTEVIGNAVKFTHTGTVTIDAHTEGGCLVCRVIDTGIGIAPDDLEHVFEEFYQVDESGDRGFLGAGLGLAIARQIMSLLGGSLTIKSEIGEGTEAMITLPLTPPGSGEDGESA
jgi:signal transduction histidine kinase